MTLKSINEELYRLAKAPEQTRADLEAAVCRLRLLLRQAEELTQEAKSALQLRLHVVSAQCLTECDGLTLLGEIDWPGMTHLWALAVNAQEAFLNHEDVCQEMRRDIDDKISTLNDKALWEAATAGDTLTKSFAWSRIKGAM